MADGNRGQWPKGTSGNPAGRPTGALTITNRQVAKALAHDGGVLPLEVLIKVMRDAWQQWLESGDQKARAMAVAIAEKAAPYFHAKLAAIEHAGEIALPVVTRMPEVSKDADAWQRQYAPRRDEVQ